MNKVFKGIDITPPVKIGTKFNHYGEVVAVGYVGERYYWLLSPKGVTSMIPATIIENLITKKK